MSEERIEIDGHVWYFKLFECHIHKPENGQGYVVGADIETLISKLTALRTENERAARAFIEIGRLARSMPEIERPNRVGKALVKIREIANAALSELEGEDG